MSSTVKSITNALHSLASQWVNCDRSSGVISDGIIGWLCVVHPSWMDYHWSSGSCYNFKLFYTLSILVQQFSEEAYGRSIITLWYIPISLVVRALHLLYHLTLVQCILLDRHGHMWQTSYLVVQLLGSLLSKGSVDPKWPIQVLHAIQFSLSSWSPWPILSAQTTYDGRQLMLFSLARIILVR